MERKEIDLASPDAIVTLETILENFKRQVMADLKPQKQEAATEEEIEDTSEMDTEPFDLEQVAECPCKTDVGNDGCKLPEVE